MRRINIVDTTIREIAEKSNFSMNFRDKIEVAKQLDRLHINVIELPSITDEKADTLLIKTIAAIIKNSTLSCNVGTSKESIDKTFLALKEYNKKRLHVILPTSPTQMEYVCNKKANKMLELIEELVSYSKNLCDDVEFSAVDATRSDKEFLIKAVKTAIQAGATVINFCDSASVMIADEFKNFIQDMKNNIPELEKIAISVECGDELSMANANSFIAAALGASQVKTSITGDYSPALETVVNSLNRRGDAYEMNCGVRTLQLQKALKQLTWFSSSNKKNLAYDQDFTSTQDNNISLNADIDINELNKIIAGLGYELSNEDSAKVYEEFKNVADKKDILTTHELEAIIASTALEVPPTYKLVNFVINSGNIINSTANVTLEKDGTKLTGLSLGDGPIEAALLAIEQILGCHYELDDFQIQSVTQGSEAIGSTLIKLRSNGKLYSGKGVSTDIIGASIRAYISALNKIVYEECNI